MKDNKPDDCPVHDNDRLLTPDDEAWLLRVSVHNLRKQMREGRFLPPIMIGPEPRWLRSDVLRWLRVQTFITARKLPGAMPAPEIPSALAEVADRLAVYREDQFPPCVYFLLRNGRVVYVGKTTNQAVRITQHRKGSNKTPRKEFDQVLYLPVELARLASAEQYFISLLKPEYNGAPGTTPPALVKG